MGILDDLFESESKDRFTIRSRSGHSGGTHTGVRQKDHGAKAGIVTYNKPTGEGKSQHTVREYSGPDDKDRASGKK